MAPCPAHGPTQYLSKSQEPWSHTHSHPLAWGTWHTGAEGYLHVQCGSRRQLLREHHGEGFSAGEAQGRGILPGEELQGGDADANQVVFVNFFVTLCQHCSHTLQHMCIHVPLSPLKVPLLNIVKEDRLYFWPFCKNFPAQTNYSSSSPTFRSTHPCIRTFYRLFCASRAQVGSGPRRAPAYPWRVSPVLSSLPRCLYNPETGK